MDRIVMTNRIARLLALGVAALAASCTVSDTKAPPLTGPSEMSLSLTLSANPDVLSLDGSSQALVTIEARDENGQLKANVPFRVETVADGQPVDYGTLSARTLVTGSNGRATLTYTAPMLAGSTIPTLQISVTPTGSGDASSHVARLLTIRLVQPGVIAVGPTPRFTFSPNQPTAFTDVLFDGATSTAGVGSAIARYEWDFGDNTNATNTSATQSHRYAAAGTYFARLTVVDTNGLSAQSVAQSVPVGAGTVPTAKFLFSPTAPAVGQSIFFNGTTSTAGAGHQIVRYDWNFGTGATRSGATVSKTYDSPGTYNVVLTVTDEVGQTGQSTQAVAIVAGAVPVATFTNSPTNPVAGSSVYFDAGSSTAPSGATVASYVWDFGDGTPTATGRTSLHTYASPFTYTVRLTITDSAGRTATTTRTVTIQ